MTRRGGGIGGESTNNLTSKKHQKTVQQQQQQQQQQPSSLQRKIEAITADLQQHTAAWLSQEVSPENAMTICNYIIAMRTESNPSREYKSSTIKALYYLSKFHNQKAFTEMTRDDIVFYLDSLRKSEIEDAQHKSIGTYNYIKIVLLRFFKWLYTPNTPHKQRKTPPPVMENIPNLRRKEISTIKPSDLWTAEDDKLFLKYCHNKRDRVYHMISRDSSCRPSELLGLKIKDLAFMRTVDGKQYALITVSGKTGIRHIPLFTSVPYIKDWLSNGHPTGGRNPNDYLIPSMMDANGLFKTKGRHMESNSVNEIYRRYKYTVFPRLINDPNTPHEDKIKLKALLLKPFNPYIRRHSALTEKAQKLTAPILRQHAGWRPGSNMEMKYTHFFGAESSEAILSEIYGLETAATLKAKNMTSAMVPKACPQCQEPNTPDSKFCHHCQMVLSYDAYTETIEEQKRKDDKLASIEKQVNELTEFYRKMSEIKYKTPEQELQHANTLIAYKKIEDAMIKSGMLQEKDRAENASKGKTIEQLQQEHAEFEKEQLPTILKRLGLPESVLTDSHEK